MTSRFPILAHRHSLRRRIWSLSGHGHRGKSAAGQVYGFTAWRIMVRQEFHLCSYRALGTTGTEVCRLISFRISFACAMAAS
jgi:hypothetical protein